MLDKMSDVWSPHCPWWSSLVHPHDCRCWCSVKFIVDTHRSPGECEFDAFHVVVVGVHSEYRPNLSSSLECASEKIEKQQREFVRPDCFVASNQIKSLNELCGRGWQGCWSCSNKPLSTLPAQVDRLELKPPTSFTFLLRASAPTPAPKARIPYLIMTTSGEHELLSLSGYLLAAIFILLPTFAGLWFDPLPAFSPPEGTSYAACTHSTPDIPSWLHQHVRRVQAHREIEWNKRKRAKLMDQALLHLLFSLFYRRGRRWIFSIFFYGKASKYRYVLTKYISVLNTHK